MSPEKEIAITLWWLGNQEVYRLVYCCMRNVCQSTCNLICSFHFIFVKNRYLHSIPKLFGRRIIHIHTYIYVNKIVSDQ